MERIGKEVERTLSTSGGGQVLALAELTSAWPDAVGEAVARNAWPLRIGRDGTLHVATTSATWAFELDRLAPKITGRLEAALGARAPARLRFRVGPVPEPGAPSPSSSASPSAGPPAGREPPSDETPEVTARADSAASEIADPELRELVARAARASLSRQAREGP
jgi:hypothetical protein